MLSLTATIAENRENRSSTLVRTPEMERHYLDRTRQMVSEGANRYEQLIPMYGETLHTERFIDPNNKDFRYCELPAHFGEAMLQMDSTLISPITHELSGYSIPVDNFTGRPFATSLPYAELKTTPETTYRYFLYIDKDGQCSNVLKVPDRLTLAKNVLSREDIHMGKLHGIEDIYSLLPERIWNREVTLGGTGTVGREVIEYLARLGIGKVKVYETDTVDTHTGKGPSVSLTERGRSKGNALQESVFKRNPYVVVEHFNEKLTMDNINDAITEETALYVCAHDDLGMKIAAWKRCRELGVPYILSTDVGSQAIIEVQTWTGGEEDNYYLGSGLQIDELEKNIHKMMEMRLKSIETGDNLLKRRAESLRKRYVALMVGPQNLTVEMLEILIEQIKTGEEVPFQQPSLAAIQTRALAGYTLELLLLKGPDVIKSNVGTINVACAFNTDEENKKLMERKLELIGELFSIEENIA